MREEVRPAPGDDGVLSDRDVAGCFEEVQPGDRRIASHTQAARARAGDPVESIHPGAGAHFEFNEPMKKVEPRDLDIVPKYDPLRIDHGEHPDPAPLADASAAPP